MAKIYLNIEAEDAADLKNTLHKLAGGDLIEIAGDRVWFPQEIEPVVASKHAEAKRAEVRPEDQAEVIKPVQETVWTPVDVAVETETQRADVELDAHGHPWSADLHASTKGKTQDGLWRMGRGKERPAPADGYPKTDATEPSPVEAAETPVQVFDADTGTFEEADEFAAFTAAAQEGEPVSTEVPARTWSDADLSKLCNQAAQKMGSPAEIKKMISDFVPAGVVDHSRNIPVEDRETFAQAIEAKAGIVYEG